MGDWTRASQAMVHPTKETIHRLCNRLGRCRRCPEMETSQGHPAKARKGSAALTFPSLQSRALTEALFFPSSHPSLNVVLAASLLLTLLSCSSCCCSCLYLPIVPLFRLLLLLLSPPLLLHMALPLTLQRWLSPAGPKLTP